MLAVPAPAAVLAGTAAVNCVAETNVVVRAVPFHSTVEVERKPVPLTVSVNAAPEPTTVAGFRAVIAGGALMGKAVALDEAPADVTVILALPAVAIRLALTDAVNWVALTNFEVSAGRSPSG
jgi:hypothetical protein